MNSKDENKILDKYAMIAAKELAKYYKENPEKLFTESANESNERVSLTVDNILNNHE